MDIDPRRVEVISERMAALHRAHVPTQRLRLFADRFAGTRALVESALRQSHPDWTPAQVRAELRRRVLRESS